MQIRSKHLFHYNGQTRVSIEKVLISEKEYIIPERHKIIGLWEIFRRLGCKSWDFEA